MRALLDVNALVALLDEEHVHHGAILEWLGHDEVLPHGFATCAITQLGCIRVMGSKGYSRPLEPVDVAGKLRQLTRKEHRYLESPAPCEGAVRWAGVKSPHSTDATLLSTAVAHGSRLVTFDAGISLKWVAEAWREHLVILG